MNDENTTIDKDRRTKQTIIVFLGVVCSLLLILGFFIWFSPPNSAGYSYMGVETHIIFSNISIDYTEIYSFFTQNKNISATGWTLNSTENPSLVIDNSFKMNASNQNNTHDMFTLNYNDNDVIINFFYVTNKSVHGNSRKDAISSSKSQYTLDLQICDRIIKSMLKELVPFLGKDPTPYEYTQIIIQNPAL